MKAVINSLDEVAEGLRGEYESKNGKFHLKVEGDYAPLAEANAKLVEFRDNNRTLNTTVTELQGKLKNFEGIDPAEYTALKTKISALEKGGVTKPDDVAEQIKAAVAAAVGPMAQKLQEREAAEQAAKAALEVSTLENAIRDIGIKMGVDERAVPDFVSRAKATFKLVNGKPVARNGEQPIFSKTKPAEELSLEEWTESTARTEAPFLFKPSKGGGANNPILPGYNGPKTVISNDPMEFGRNLEKIAKGEVIVQQ